MELLYAVVFVAVVLGLVLIRSYIRKRADQARAERGARESTDGNP